MQIGTHTSTERPDDRDRCGRQGLRRRGDLWCGRHHLNVDPTNDNTRAVVSASGGHAGVCRSRLHWRGKSTSRWLKARRIDLGHALRKIGSARQRGPSDARPQVSVHCRTGARTVSQAPLELAGGVGGPNSDTASCGAPAGSVMLVDGENGVT